MFIILAIYLKDNKSLISLPDISNWKTSNIFDMSGLFYGCYNLSKICEINK